MCRKLKSNAQRTANGGYRPQYLASRGAQFGETSLRTTFRNYTFVNMSGIFGPILASLMCTTFLGRKYTLATGALLTMAFLFCFTQVKTVKQTIGINCAISFCLVGKVPPTN